MKEKIPKHILPVIVIAQFTGTSLWFAGNAVVPDMIQELGLSETFIGFITMAVQGGFIFGTLVFAGASLADRYSPVKVFLLCSLAGALANLLTIVSPGVIGIMSARVATGFFLAGIYPVGMKIASDWHREGLGKALGYLVGALVVGTAFPHLIKYLGSELPWRFVLISTSVISTFGGLLMYFSVEDGPYRGKAGIFKPAVMIDLFKDNNFRAAAFGYFGHMWELYTFWAFVPVMLGYYLLLNPDLSMNIPLFSFLIIGVGGLSCAFGGHVSIQKGSQKVAAYALSISGICCLLLPFLFEAAPILFLMALFAWGLSVVPDSPQFSTLVARSSDPAYVATGLTIVNSLGFALTIVSIQLINYTWIQYEDPRIFWLILPGPLFGLYHILKYRK